jgi:Holliday junction DNA helicase RuvB
MMDSRELLKKERPALADRALAMHEIDADRFDEWDRILEALIHKFGGGTVGLNSLAVAISEDAGTLEEVNEPYLIMQGYLKRTPQGRVAMPAAYRKLGVLAPAREGELFGGS